MSSLLFDLRVAARRLLARRAGTLVAIVMLSAGIGAVSTMFLLFRGATDDLPHLPGVERIGRVLIQDPEQRETRIPPAEAERRAWLDASPHGITLAVVNDSDVTIDPVGVTVQVQYVSDGYFDVAGVAPEIGRRFTPGEQSVIVSRRLWNLLPDQMRTLGATLVVDGQPCTLVGVMPPSFWMPSRGVDAWLPRNEKTSTGWTNVFARLDPALTAQHAAAVLTPVVQHLRGPKYSVHVILLSADARVRRTMGVLMFMAPALLLLVAVCANVAGLLLGDLYRRRQELAVRAALGASRWRLAREVMCDALIVSIIGGLVSLAGAYWSVRALRSAFGTVSPDFASMLPSFTAVAPVALAAPVLAVLGIGYVPALLASRVRIVADLAGTGPALFRRGRYGGGDLLLVLQIAVAAALVLWTVTFASVFRQVFEVAPYVPVERVWEIGIESRSKSTIGADTAAAVLARARVAPGIETAGLAAGSGTRRAWTATTRTGSVSSCSASLKRVSGPYFDAYGYPTTGALPESEGVVVNEIARRRCGDPVDVRDIAGGPSRRVIGSVDDRWYATRVPGPPRGAAVIYAPLGAPVGPELILTIRSRSTSAGDVRALTADLARTSPAVTFSEPLSLAAEREHNLGAAVLVGKMMAVLTALCLLLGIVGLHAAITQALAVRTREIGVRIALGAARHDVLAATVGHHAPPALIGVVLGAAVTVGGLAMLRTDDASMIRELALLSAKSPAWWAPLLGLLLASAVLSAMFPVARALRINPAEVLRQE